MAAITLRGLLQRPDLALQLVSALTPDAAGMLDRPLRWGYSTDLLDPTPFLRGRELILTTGQQLWAAADVESATHDYVARIARGGAAGLVYTLEQPDAQWEALLRHSCVDAGVPLLEAPFSTPFISISEAISSSRQDPEREGMRRVLHAQHALTLAALERTPAQALVRELSLLLGCSVWLWGTGARVLCAAPVEQPPAWVEPVVRGRVGDARRRRQAGREVHGGQNLFIHTLNTPGAPQPLGALTLLQTGADADSHAQTGALDRDDRMIVNSAVAMLQLALASRPPGALEHDEVAQFGLRALIADDLVTGRALLGRSLFARAGSDAAQQRWSLLCTGSAPAVRGEPAVSVRLPDERVWVTLCATPEGQRFDEMTDRLLRERTGASPRQSGHGGAVAVELPGFSTANATGLAAPLAAALWRYRRLAASDRRVERVDADETSVLRALAEDAHCAAGLRDVADAALLANAASRDGSLIDTFTAWCACMYSWQAAAERLGVHRNTVVRRVRTLGEALGRDLEHDPSACRTTWLALAVSETAPAAART